MKTDDLQTDNTAKGFANRVALRLADRYPVGSVDVQATANGEGIKVTIVSGDGKETARSYDIETLLEQPDPLLIILPDLPDPAKVGAGVIKETPSDEAAARAIATDTDLEPNTILTRPEAENGGVEGEVTIANTEAVTPDVDGTRMIVTAPNDPEIADAETAKESAAKLDDGTEVKRAVENVGEVAETARAADKGETADAAEAATRTRTRADADAAKAEASKADAAKADKAAKATKGS